MNMKVFVNGILTENFHLDLDITKCEMGFFGKIKAQFPDGSKLVAKIKGEMLTQLLASTQHLYDTDKGRVAVEYFE